MARSGHVEVGTRSGRVRGAWVDGPGGDGAVARFLGVPFAAPPSGDLRFAAPVPPPRWDGVRDATVPGPNAPQPDRRLAGIDLGPILGPGWHRGEDYLTVDVWTPDPGAGLSSGGLPVMVFVHGGAFIAGGPGAPAYDGRALASRGVVLVSMTYRLGVEGFVALPGGATNVGLRDQLAALAWVRNEVAAFGGDPDLVTVFGESAGGMSIGCLLGSPLARGLFRRAIVQSGGAEMVRTPDTVVRIAAALAEQLGVTPDAAAFRSRSVADAIAAQEIVSAPGHRPDLREAGGNDPGFGLGVFTPVVGDDVLPEPPLDALDGDVDLLVGANRDEMNLYFVPSGVADAVTAEQVRAMVAAVWPHPDEVLGGRPAGETPGATLVRVFNELVFHGPARRLAAAHAAAGSGSTHAYEFAWPSPACGGRLGACHGLELPFVFGTLACAAGLLGEDPPAAVSDAMLTAWTEFARTGDPGWAAHPAVEVVGSPVAV